MNSRATQSDVAREAGVARSVVSLVLNGKAGTTRVSPETAARVKAAAKRLGYRPDRVAQNLRLGRTYQIGILHGDGFPRIRFTSPYFSTLMDAIVDRAFEHGFTVALCPQLHSATPEDAMADGRFDGLLWYSTTGSPANMKRLRDCSVPIVMIHTRASDYDVPCAAVACDNESGIRQAINHLVELGHRSIAYVITIADLFGEAVDRRATFQKYGEELGLTLCQVVLSGYDADLPADFRKDGSITAVIGFNDEVADLVVRQLRARGVDVPGDVSVIGFDSTPLCEVTRPTLTSVSQSLSEIGTTAVDLLIDSIDGRLELPYDHVVECRLDVRESTGPPRAQAD